MVGGQASVGAEYLLIDDSGNGEAVEHITEGLPELDVVPAATLIVEAINTIDACALMVATEDEEVLRIADLEGKEEADGLDGLSSTVDVVTQEEVVCIGRKATILEEPEQVVVLAVDVSTYFDWSIELQERHLLKKDGPGLHAKTPDFIFLKIDLPTRALTAHL